MELGEALGAIAALQQKRLAVGHAAELFGQAACLTGEHQRRVAGERRFRLGQLFRIRPIRLLQNGLVTPT